MLAGLLATGGCARHDLRDLIPNHALAADVAPRPATVALVSLPLGELPPPPGLQQGAASLLPEPVGTLVGSVPLLGRVGAADTPAWVGQARRHDVVTPAVLLRLCGRKGPLLERHRRPYALSDEAAAVMDARAAGASAVLWIKAAVGPDDAAQPFPGRVAVSAEAALLDAREGTTLARAHDTVSLPVHGAHAQAVADALRRAGAELGRRLALSMRWGGTGLGVGRGAQGVKQPTEDEEMAAEEAARKALRR